MRQLLLLLILSHSIMAQDIVPVIVSRSYSFTDDFNGSLTGYYAVGNFTTSSGKASCSPGMGSDLISNGGFANNTGWSEGAGWLIGSGVATATSSTSGLTQSVTHAAGFTYATLDVTATSGSVAFHYPTLWYGNRPDVSGSYFATQYDVANVGYRIFSVAFTGSVDNATLKRLNTNSIMLLRETSMPNIIVMADSLSATNGTQIGIIISYADSLNYVFACLRPMSNGSHDIIMEKVVAGVQTDLTYASPTFSTSKTLEVRKHGTTYRVFYDGVQQDVDVTITDAALVGATRHGVFSTYPINTIGRLRILSN